MPNPSASSIWQDPDEQVPQAGPDNTPASGLPDRLDPGPRSGGVRAAFLSFYLVLISTLSIGLLVAVWPTAPTPSWLSDMSAEMRYLLLVVCGAALGGSMATSQSLLTLARRTSLPGGWPLWYAFRVLVGIPLAMAFYVIFRGLLLSPRIDYSILNPFGILIVSVVIGMFAMQALDKLNALGATLFKSEAGLEQQIDRISTALGVAVLDNYVGFVCFSVHEKSGKVGTADPRTTKRSADANRSAGVRTARTISWSADEPPVLLGGQSYELHAWFQPDAVNGMFSTEVRVMGGADTRSVEFKLVPDSDSVRLRPVQESVSFPVRGTSPLVTFEFETPKESGPYDIWVEVFQKNRLIHVVPLTYNIGGTDTETYPS